MERAESRQRAIVDMLEFAVPKEKSTAKQKMKHEQREKAWASLAVGQSLPLWQSTAAVDLQQFTVSCGSSLLSEHTGKSFSLISYHRSEGMRGRGGRLRVD